LEVCLLLKDGINETNTKSGNNQFRGRNPSFKISSNTGINKATKEFILGSNIEFNYTRA
jgi:hypothetical protein